MYEDAFETKFLKATEALYHEEGNRYMQETDVSYHYFEYRESMETAWKSMEICGKSNVNSMEIHGKSM